MDFILSSINPSLVNINAASEDRNVENLRSMFVTLWRSWIEVEDKTEQNVSIKDEYTQNYILSHIVLMGLKDKFNMEAISGLDFKLNQKTIQSCVREYDGNYMHSKSNKEKSSDNIVHNA